MTLRPELGPDTMRSLWPTVAEPAFFAPPVEAWEDVGGVTVVFDVTGIDVEALRVDVIDHALFLRGERSRGGAGREPLRVFAFPTPVDAASLESHRTAHSLTVRIEKRAAAARRILIAGTK